MSDTGWVSPTSTGGTYNNWVNPTNAYSGVDTYALTGDEAGGYDDRFAVSLSKDGGSNWTSSKNINIVTDSPYDNSAGGSDDLWGTTWSSGDFDSENFRIYLNGNYYGGQDYGGFDFGIASGSTINGVEVYFNGYYPDGNNNTRVYYIQIKVYYTDSSTPTVGVKYPLPAFKRS